MENVNTQIYDRVIDRAAMVRLYERRTIDKVEVVINGHAVRIDKLIKESKLAGRNFTAFEKKLDEEIKRTFLQAKQITGRSLLDLFRDQSAQAVQTLNMALSDIWRVKQPPRSIAEDIVFNKPLYENVTLERGFAGLAKREKVRLEAIIREGIAKGHTEGAIADTVMKAGYNITRNQARGLVVTATTSVYSQADHQVYLANNNALLGWQYVAVLDSRTTPLCAHRDGKIYPITDTEHLPPAHWHCRSTTIPIVKSYEQLGQLEGIAQIRKRNLAGLSEKQIAFYDGQTPLRESYNTWLTRQPAEVQLRHLGDSKGLEAFRAGQLTVDRFTNPTGRSIGIKELRQITDSGFGTPGDTRRFAIAKEKLDAIRLGYARPEELYEDPKTLKEYYKLQAGELDGTLSLTNYRGALLHNKKATKQRVLNVPPTEANLKYNPLTGRYDDARMYQPSPATLKNVYRLVSESDKLKDIDKEFITKFVDSLENEMGVNERAVVMENLRITIGRFRENKLPWTNLKAVLQGQIKFDVMNVSEYMETQARKDANILLKLKQENYIDPVLGPTQLQQLHDNFRRDIKALNRWDDRTAPKLAKRLRNILDYKIPVKLKIRLTDKQLSDFYLRFVKRLSLADSPDRDQLAIALGRDLYNAANYSGSRNEWFNAGVKILEDANKKGFYELETFGVQKRRMKSRIGGRYFGPYYDTFAVNLKITNPKIVEYAKLTRKVEMGMRVPVVNDSNRLVIREGYKTYFLDDGVLGYYDTRIPITSTSSFKDFPTELIDRNMAEALNWTAQAKYKVDPDFFDFVKKLLYFQDDKGKAQYYHDLNKYREYMVERGDAYERLKAMEWLRGKDLAFSNNPFLDHRARIYERGLIGPQSGETFRPFLSTEKEKALGELGYYNLRDQIGAFLGGASDTLEGNFNSLSIVGRQQIADKWHKGLVELGNHMRRGMPNDIRKVLEHPLMAEIDGEEQGKLMRFALEMSKIDEFLRTGITSKVEPYSSANLSRLSNYKTALALEQDASSSGAQIIALTTRNMQLARLSNVVPTDQKQRLYDEIAAATYNDPRFRELNQKLGLTEKDLRKAAKAQNMVTFYGAGERTGILNVEGKLGKVLGGDDAVLVVKAADRDTVLSEISARMARYETLDPELYQELKTLRKDVKDIFNKGLKPGDDIMDQLYFLEPKTRDLVEKLGRSYTNVVTPEDFQIIAEIMSENLRSQVPILKDFTKFFGRLASDFLSKAKPKNSDFDNVALLKTLILGAHTSGTRLPPWLNQILAIKNTSIRDQLLERIPGYVPGSFFDQVITGVRAPTRRRTGFKIGKFSIFSEDITKGFEIGIANKLDKSWTNVPWVNFDGKVLEQNFTQVFEEKLAYKDSEGNWITNIIQVPQKTSPNWWEEFRNKDGKINDIADVNKAITAYAVNGNHSNDATLVKQFHLWGKRKNIQTSTVHDAFFANAADMLQARAGLRDIYAKALDNNSIKATLDELRARGLPRELYDKYLNEAIEIGLIPVVGRSRVGGRLLTKDDILTKEDILENVKERFNDNRYWYGIG